MTPEEKELLEHTHKLTAENNKILHTLRTAHRWSVITRVLYWALIIGVALGAFYYIQPYIEAIGNVYGGLQNEIDNVKNLTNKLPF